MARATYTDLITEVRAQIAVDSDRAYTWLLDRARVLNAESAWLFIEADLDPPLDPDGRYYELLEDVVWIEAVIVGGAPYQRSTLHAMDARWTGNTGNTLGIYAAGQGETQLQIHPPTASPISVRYVQDVLDDPASVPPFPSDFDQALIDGAIAIGLARMDERFDSASYFESRFATAIGRLRRRRHGHAGRGAVSIRVLQ